MLMLIAGFSTLFTMLFLSFLYYEINKKQVMEELRDYTLLVRSYWEDGDTSEINSLVTAENKRLTIISPDGQVIYDNEIDFNTMNNHNERPEIIEAQENGYGESIRHSDTLSQSVFYTAIKLSDGNIIRIGKRADSLYFLWLRALPGLFVLLLMIFILCMVLAKIFTRKLIAPLIKMKDHWDDFDERVDYEELTPFINTIKEQHDDIMKNARIRQEFSANVSHELKTPLTAITGYAELIETGMASEENVEKFANGIHSSANRLLTLINDTIRLSELDSNAMELNLEKINLYQLIQSNAEMMQINANKHQIELTISGEDSFIRGDRQMLEELIFNLCDNAVRYNNKGGKVAIKVKTEDNLVKLEVKDTGIGIPLEHQKRIFERFYRVDKSRSKSTGGTGLGLAIVKHIVAKHQAEINLDSRVGEGTTICVTFMNWQ